MTKFRDFFFVVFPLPPFGLAVWAAFSDPPAAFTESPNEITVMNKKKKHDVIGSLYMEQVGQEKQPITAKPNDGNEKNEKKNH